MNILEKIENYITQNIDLTCDEVEFNTGFITALILFYAHKDMFNFTGYTGDLRLYGATDHLFDMEIPENLTPEHKERIENLKESALDLRMEIIKRTDGDKIFAECKTIVKMIADELPEIDKACLYLIFDDQDNYEIIKDGSVSKKWIELLVKIDQEQFGIEKVCVNYP
jgi:RNA polymerase subunit RPABC4/transcription elongation factor Spt4